jgi:hypothetical protein
MWSSGISYSHALTRVQRARDMAQPNPSFARQLQGMWTRVCEDHTRSRVSMVHLVGNDYDEFV